jgi:hypothetical protein
LARRVQAYCYELKVAPSTKTAADMQAVMLIIRRLVEREVTDEFDDQPFGDIPRLARLQTLIDNLSECGVRVIACIIARTKDQYPEFFRHPGHGMEVDEMSGISTNQDALRRFPLQPIKWDRPSGNGCPMGMPAGPGGARSPVLGPDKMRILFIRFVPSDVEQEVLDLSE